MALALTHPCPDGTDTDPFGWRPAIPGVVGAQLHTGQDTAADEGTPVYAAHAGRVTRTYIDRFTDGRQAGGNMIELGSARCVTRYAHLSRYAVRAGDEVKRGQLIGYVGSTGAATGPHLHFELLIAGSFVDPRPYIRKDIMTDAQLQKILDAIEKIPARTLGYSVQRADNKRKRTNLKTLIAHNPARVLETRTRLVKLAGQLAQLLKR